MSSNDNKNVTNPGPHDILCGRGGGTNAHPGNIKFRKLVAAHKLRYLAASKSDKPGVARDVVREWRAMDPPGRFLAKLDKGKLPEGGGDGGGDDGLTVWYDVGDKKAREKASQCLRERNGAANEAVAALVKTVTASGEACPEDYATLMNKAAKVKAQNDLTIQRQNEMIKMNALGGMASPGMGGPGMGGPGMGGPGMVGSGGNNFCQEAFEPISLQQQRFPPGTPGTNFSGDNMNNGGIKSEDDLIEAEIQRLLKQRQQLMANNPGYNNRGDAGMNRMGGMGGGGMGGGGMGSGMGGGGMGSGMSPVGGGNMPQAGGQPYMGEDNVMREYEQLMQKQRELNMMAGKLGGMGGGGGMNGGMSGLINTFNSNGMNSHMMSQASSNMLNPNMNNMMNSPMGGNNMMNGPMGGNNNNYGGQGMSNPMQSGHNPDAAKDYMNRLRSMRQGGSTGSGNGSGVPDQAISSAKPEGHNNDGYPGNSGNGIMGNNNGGGNSNNMMMNNMGGNMQPQMQGNNVKSEVQGGRAPDQFTIEEYQASLQQFLSHNDDLGGTSIKNENADQIARGMSQQTQQAGNLTGNVTAGGVSMQVPTNLGDGNNNVRAKDRRRSVDDMDLPVPLNRNTFKSVDSAERPSFQSMDDMDIRGTFKSVDDSMDIRGTFKSVDTMDLMSIGNSINEIIEDDARLNPEARKKYGRRMSNASSRGYRRPPQPPAGAGAGGPASGAGAGTSLGDYAHLPGRTLEIKTLDHGQARPSGGPRKMKKGIDPRLVAHAKGMMGRHSVQTKEKDGPSGGGRGSMLSIKDLNLDGVDDASRMSFGNMSVMSELTDFQEMMARGQDSFALP